MTKASRDASVSVEAKHTAPSSDKGGMGLLEGWFTRSRS